MYTLVAKDISTVTDEKMYIESSLYTIKVSYVDTQIIFHHSIYILNYKTCIFLSNKNNLTQNAIRKYWEKDINTKCFSMKINTNYMALEMQ